VNRNTVNNCHASIQASWSVRAQPSKCTGALGVLSFICLYIIRRPEGKPGQGISSPGSNW
jgi:hypothetical protein